MTDTKDTGEPMTATEARDFVGAINARALADALIEAQGRLTRMEVRLAEMENANSAREKDFATRMDVLERSFILNRALLTGSGPTA